jgi:hypothetical protein
MTNPWLDIPEADYVGHMTSPAVGQRPVLGRLMGEVLETVRPNVVLVLGCSTGNGLEYVNLAVTSRANWIIATNPISFIGPAPCAAVWITTIGPYANTCLIYSR